MARPEYDIVCPFDPSHKCDCNSKFAKKLFRGVVNSLIKKHKLSPNEAVEQYKEALKRKPITAIEGYRHVNKCNHSNIGSV